MRRRTTLLALGSLLAGLAAAVALTTAPAAQAWDIHALPAGYSVEHDTSTSSVCPDSYYIFGYGKTSPQLCTDSPSFQQDLDAFIDATCPVAVCPPPAAPTTATTAADPPPAPTTTAADPPPPPAPTTTSRPPRRSP
jgi:hypothetical protein